MLDVFDKFAVDLNAEINGTWKEFHGARILIARSGNKNFNKAIAEAYDKHEEQISKKDEAADKLAEKLLLETIADTLVLDWEGVGYKGEEVKYSKANVIKLLGKPEMRDFRNALLALSEDAEIFRLKKEEEQTKNS